MTLWLFMAQRLSAIVMAPLVIGHIVLMIIAVRNGLTAGEILGRTRGSAVWAMYYGVFVIAVSVHAAIGLRNIASETFRWRGASLELATFAAGALLLALGGRAVYAVIA
jgi:fumarate reductase subunit C